MSKVVARTQKVKSGNLIGIGNHNQRKFEKHSNAEIDPEKKNLNYDLVQGRTENFKTDIEKFIDENKSTKRATRKDAVLVNEWLISSDQAFFENLPENRTREFFETSKDYFSEKFGDQNIRYAIVHLDETTPHMHMGVVPFDKDNKLSAKRVFNKTALKEIQAELPEYLKERGFDIERGEKDSERKNLSVPEYKKAMAEVELIENETETLYQTKNALEDEIEPLREEVNKLSEKRDGLAKELSATYVEDPKKIYRSNQSKDHVLVHRQDIARYQKQNELVPKLVKQNENLQAENKELDDENISLLEENQIQEAQIFQMQEMLEMARERMERFVEKGAKLWDRVVTYSSKFYPKAKEITPSEMQNNDDGERDYQEWRLRARRHEMER